MQTALRRLPGFVLAIVALALSASLAFAGQPLGSTAGLGIAAGHAGKTVPVKAQVDTQGADEDTDTDTDETDQTDETQPDETDQTDETDQADETDTSDSAAACTVDLTQDDTVLLTLNHGSVVCSAAQATTWDTTLYPNRGAWVSHFAKLNHGHDPSRQHGKSGH